MEVLPDPLDDREKKDILAPPQKPLKTELLYLNKSGMNLLMLIIIIFINCLINIF